MHTKNSSRDFIEIPIFCRIWYYYMKEKIEKIFFSWLVYLNLQKKINFASFKRNISAVEPIPEIVETIPQSKLYPDFQWYTQKLYLLLLKDDPKHVFVMALLSFNGQICLCWAAGKRVWRSSCYALVGRACGRLWRNFYFVAYVKQELIMGKIL